MFFYRPTFYYGDTIRGPYDSIELAREAAMREIWWIEGQRRQLELEVIGASADRTCLEYSNNEAPITVYFFQLVGAASATLGAAVST